MTDNPCNCESCNKVQSPKCPPFVEYKKRWKSSGSSLEVYAKGIDLITQSSRSIPCMYHPRAREVLISTPEIKQGIIDLLVMADNDDSKSYTQVADEILAHIIGGVRK